mgnify:CR=1 FL=1
MSNEGVSQQFTSTEEEIRYLREQIAARERELLARTPEVDQADVETVGRTELKEYAQFTPRMVLAKEHQLTEPELAASVEQAQVASDPVREILQIASERGIRNALSVLEKIDNAYVIDEVHRQLVAQIRGGVQIQDLKEGVPPWQIMHMTLYEVMLPEVKGPDNKEYQLAELVGMMEQLFAGLRTIGSQVAHNHFVLEIAVADFSDEIVFYVAVPNQFTTLFEKQTLSLFPHAQLAVQANDYNIFVDGGVNLITEVGLKKHPIYPLKTHDKLSADPLMVILNAFSKIEREGGGAAIQFVLRHPQKKYRKDYEEIIKDVQKGMKPSEAISRSSVTGAIVGGMTDFFFSNKKKEDEKPREVDSNVVEVFNRKIQSDIVEANIRLAVSAKESYRADQIMTELESTFHQFEAVDGNQFTFSRAKGGTLKRLEKAFSFREFIADDAIPLNLTELSTVVHFPGNGVLGSPQFKQSQSATAPAPLDLPSEGTLLGINRHRNSETPIYMTELDRMRHMYIIGQTGTGKSNYMKSLVIQDIQAGAGVCMIDPHGNDIRDIIASIPPERADDLVYFDPSNLERVIGLNMLEFDPQKPEQKTFVVNELFSIFKKLYGANPESMGPMFEQYFRNSTMLVMEDPESGNTLLDISRVMADAQYRKYKISKATNPVVIQFWTEIANKAGGEQSLENFVPYITSKIDPLTANDYIRPIIGQQKSSFNFRELMDQRKILLVNLSKGRLGEINANLIGMIIVGKFLMAALSRVDAAGTDYAPFYLHIDEFQNVSTPSIAAILSEARKYKLSLTMAHQFIAQLDEEIKDAVFGNVGSLSVFRIGAEDAQFMESQFAPVFSAKDIMNIPNYNAFLRILMRGTPVKPFSVATMPMPDLDFTRVDPLIAHSLARFGRPRAEIEAEIQARYQKKPATPPPLTGLV